MDHRLTRDDIFRYNNTPNSVWGGTLHQEAFPFLYKEQNIRIETWSPLICDTKIVPPLQDTPDSPIQNNIWKRKASPNHLDASTRYIHLIHTQYDSKSWASTDIARIPLETDRNHFDLIKDIPSDYRLTFLTLCQKIGRDPWHRDPKLQNTVDNIFDDDNP